MNHFDVGGVKSLGKGLSQLVDIKVYLFCFKLLFL